MIHTHLHMFEYVIPSYQSEQETVLNETLG